MRTTIVEISTNLLKAIQAAWEMSEEEAKAGLNNMLFEDLHMMMKCEELEGNENYAKAKKYLDAYWAEVKERMKAQEIADKSQQTFDFGKFD